jgi:hypothetical protein
VTSNCVTWFPAVGRGLGGAASRGRGLA